MTTRIPSDRRRRSRGNTMIEFALAFPLLFLIFIGTFQFGYSFYVFHRLESTVRAAARFGAIYPYTSSNGNPTTEYLTAIKNYAVSGGPDAATPLVVPGLTTDHIVVTVSTLNGVPNRVKVAITGYQINAIFQTFTLDNRPFSSFRYAGRIAAL